MRWADARGDSFRLSVLAKERPQADFIVFCGVHFMAESADILTGARAAGDPARPQRRVLDGRHGRHRLRRGGLGGAGRASSTSSGVVPITYMNSSAALKAFVGRHGGAVCTSTNARAVLEWVFRPRSEGGAGGQQVLFFPDQHLGRNTGAAMGYSADDMRVWNPRLEMGGLSEADLKDDDVPALEGPLLGPPAVPAVARGRVPGRPPGRHRGRPPRVRPRGVRPGRPGRLDGLHHPCCGGGPGRLGHRRRHGDPPRQPARTTSRRTRRSCRSIR